MKSIQNFFGLQIVASLLLLIFAGSIVAAQCGAQTASVRRPATTAVAAAPGVPALMVSDIHFDPFHDPDKLQKLIDAPVDQWSAILAAPPSPNQNQAFEALQQQCKLRGVDTSYDLLQSSLQTMRARQADAKFMTVSGDLMAHSFSCRFKELRPQSTESDYQAFALKTVSFVVSSLQLAFPHIPIYVAMGNNDSGCGDYKLDAGSDFLAKAGKIFGDALPLPQRQDLVQQFAAGGYYNIAMAAPMKDTRLIVVNDVYLSPKYTTCGGMPNLTAANAEMDWLRQQLVSAQQAGQKVWIMGHIPPGINAPSTVLKMKNICADAKPVTFLSSGIMADLMLEHASTIRLGIFGHTHMDELRLLQPEAGDTSPTAEHSVVLKLVPSITPIDGNNPSFTVARINPFTATLEDYAVIAASNQNGVGATWSQEYDYARTYHEADFSPATVKDLIAKFHADPGSQQEISNDYIRNYFVGDRSVALKPFWPQYACSLGNTTAKSYASCVCATGK